MPLHDSQQWGTPSFYFLMGDMFSAEPAILFHFQAIRIIFFYSSSSNNSAAYIPHRLKK
jgi:hypothetical protein